MGFCFLAACGDDDGDDTGDTTADAADVIDSGTADANTADLLERGRYLTENVYICDFCHTPAGPTGPGSVGDPETRFSGVDCMIDLDPESDTDGCLATGNITNHATGIGDLSDAEVKTIIRDGEFPDGQILHNFMPYFIYHNIEEADLDAIVFYLRTLSVDHEKPAQQAPWDTPPDEKVAFVNWAQTQDPDPEYAELESATRGKYFANTVCAMCHIPPIEGAELVPGVPGPFPIEEERSFTGHHFFQVPSPPFTVDLVESRNITPDDELGIGTFEIMDVLNVLHEATDPRDDEFSVICVMPAGEGKPFHGVTDADATDIANYLFSLPGVNEQSGVDCGLQ